MNTRGNRIGAGLVLAFALMTAGCAEGSGAAAQPGGSTSTPVKSAHPATAPVSNSGSDSARPSAPADPSAPTLTALPRSMAKCPLPAADASFAAVDYVDFLQANHTQYISGLGAPEVTVAAAEIGAEQFRVRCTFTELNSVIGKMTPPPGDGDAGFLPAGTAVHAVRGWSPLCRLAAERGGKWRVYLAYEPNAAKATPKPCASK